MNCSSTVSYVHEILQARILEWIAIPFSRGSSQPGIEPRFPSSKADFFTIWVYVYVYVYVCVCVCVCVYVCVELGDLNT